MALERRAYTGPSPQCGLRAATHAATSRQVAAVAWKAGARARLERPRVQILVVVANIQTRTLKTEVEKGSM
jgi:hypothetical protein